MNELQSRLEDLDLTILMPCLNEAETLETCVRKALRSLGELGLQGEVVVADNGSTDGSQAIAQRLGARVVPVARKGYGSALQAGIEAAHGRWIVMGDSDDSYDFSDLGRFVQKLREGFELVMGCRMPYGGGTIMPGAMPWKHRWLGNPVLSFIGRLFFGCPVTDFHCGLRAFTKEGWRKLSLKTTGMEFASEMVIKATLRGLRITEVPITLHKDGRSRPPHLRSWRDGWRHLRFMLLFSPRWLFLVPGIALMLAGLALFLPLCFGPLRLIHVTLDTNTFLVAGFALVAGAQILFFGVFSRKYCTARGLLPESPQMAALLQWFSLERGIVVGGLLVAMGLSFLGGAFWKWSTVHFGSMSYPDSLRLVIPSVTCLTLGVQVIFQSFCLSVLDLKHD